MTEERFPCLRCDNEIEPWAPSDAEICGCCFDDLLDEEDYLNALEEEDDDNKDELENYLDVQP